MEQEVLFEGIRALFIVGVPIILVTAIIGLLASAFQTSTALHDPVISYALKVSAIAVFTIFLCYHSFVRTLIALTESAHARMMTGLALVVCFVFGFRYGCGPRCLSFFVQLLIT